MRIHVFLLAAVLSAVSLADTYEPVEFIVSTGSQYADTGVRLNPARSRIDARFVLMENIPSTVRAENAIGIAGAFYCSPNPKPGQDESTSLSYNNRSLCFSQSWYYNNQSLKRDVECILLNFVRSENQEIYRIDDITARVAANRPWWIHQTAPAYCYYNTPGSTKGYAGYNQDKKDCWIGTCYLSAINKTAAFDDKEGAVTGEPFNPEGSMAKVKWYGFQITTNDVLQADLIPARRTSDSVYGFYDRVRGTFHPSKTSTPFVGPTICPWTPSASADPMDASHYSGTVPSSNYDVISVPANTVLDIPSAASATAMSKFGGIRLEEPTSTCVFSNLASGVAFQTPFYGEGVVQFLNSPGYLAVYGDSTDFRGRFTITNACLTVGWQRTFGVTNCVHIYEGYMNVNGRRVDFTCGGAVYQNEFHFEAAYSSSQGSVIYSTSSGSTFAGPNYFPCKSQIWFQHGDVTYTWSGPIYPEGETANTIKCNSRAERTIFNGADKWLGLNTLYLTQSSPIDCYFHGTHKTFVKTAPAPGNILLGNGKRLGLNRADVFDENFSVGVGWVDDQASSIYNVSGGIDMNGHDQRIGRLSLSVRSSLQYDGRLFPNFTITTPDEQPATLTIHEGLFVGHGKALENYPGLYPGRLTGPVSIVLDVNEAYNPSSIRFVTTNETAGAMIARRGTIAFGASAKFENLTALVATKTGLIEVNTPDVGNATNLFVAVTNATTAKIEIAADVTLKADLAFMGKRWLDAGRYSSVAGPGVQACPQLSGTGILEVQRYGGKSGFVIFFK